MPVTEVALGRTRVPDCSFPVNPVNPGQGELQSLLDVRTANVAHQVLTISSGVVVERNYDNKRYTSYPVCPALCSLVLVITALIIYLVR